MTKEAYFEIYNTEPDVINLSKEDIVEWIDTIAENARKLYESAYTLDYGKLNEEKGEYEYHIHPCSHNEYLTLHIFEGIDKIADAVGVKLSCEDRYSPEYPYMYSFEYKLLKIFQIEKEPLVDERGV